jgi:hypothetical protein
VVCWILLHIDMCVAIEGPNGMLVLGRSTREEVRGRAEHCHVFGCPNYLWRIGGTCLPLLVLPWLFLRRHEYGGVMLRISLCSRMDCSNVVIPCCLAAAFDLNALGLMSAWVSTTPNKPLNYVTTKIA